MWVSLFPFFGGFKGQPKGTALGDFGYPEKHSRIWVWVLLRETTRLRMAFEGQPKKRLFGFPLPGPNLKITRSDCFRHASRRYWRGPGRSARPTLPMPRSKPSPNPEMGVSFFEGTLVLVGLEEKTKATPNFQNDGGGGGRFGGGAGRFGCGLYWCDMDLRKPTASKRSVQFLFDSSQSKAH